MRVAILHNLVPPDASEAERDVFIQIAAVSQALSHLGHEPVRVAATLDLSELRSQLSWLKPDVVFNLVESLEGSDWLMFVVTGLLDAIRMPYTGSPTESILLANHKILAKERLAQAGLPTPMWLPGPGTRHRSGSLHAFLPGTTYVLKAVSQHASVGLDDRCVVTADERWTLDDLLVQKSEQMGCDCFAEEYVDGREFNISLLASPHGAEVLPLAEIDFTAFPQDKPRIVGYRAKWDERSFEYNHTPRRFNFPGSDQPLLDTLGSMARTCWDVCGLQGYGRVDFRIDAAGRPWILEVNANPCLSPDAGFAAALQRASIPFDQAIQRIFDDALASNSRPAVPGRSADPAVA